MPTDPSRHTPRLTFRLGAATEGRLAELARHYGTSHTDVIRLAVADAHARVFGASAGDVAERPHARPGPKKNRATP